jgi:hypothetical protein
MEGERVQYLAICGDAAALASSVKWPPSHVKLGAIVFHGPRSAGEVLSQSVRAMVKRPEVEEGRRAQVGSCVTASVLL